MVRHIKNKNNDFQYIETLRTNRNKRFSERRFLVEGVRNINEAVRCGWKIEAIAADGSRNLSDWAAELINKYKSFCDVLILDNGLMNLISGKEETSELIFIIKMQEYSLDEIEIKNNSVILIFDRPSNKGNLGTIIRTADSFGIDSLITTGHGIDYFDPEVIGATMGSFFRQKFVHEPSMNNLSEWINKNRLIMPNLSVCGTSAKGTDYLSSRDFSSGPVIAVIGNETSGMSRSFFDLCDCVLKIPMSEDSSASSLNVANAASVILYEIIRHKYN